MTARSLMLLNLNAIHPLSNWLGWKVQEKFQVEFRFYKVTGSSYVSMLKRTQLIKTSSK